jgi:hypothetical protein
MKFYQITTEKATYNAVVKISETSGKQEIYLGGEKYYCLEVTYDQLNLTKDVDCFINKKQENVNASDLMYAMLYLLKFLSHDRDICRIELIDTSYNKHVGNLSSYYLAFYQQTWYEKNFNAYLEDIPTRDLYQDQKKIFDSYRPSSAFNFRSRLNMEDHEKETILDLYDSSSSYKEFFEKIKKDKRSIKPWLDSFVKDVLGFGFISHKKWIIECNNDKVKLHGKFTIKEIYQEPFVKYNGRYVSIVKRNYYLKQIGSGMKILDINQRRSFKNPNWIGWKNIDLDEYCDRDKKFLKKQLKNFT